MAEEITFTLHWWGRFRASWQWFKLACPSFLYGLALMLFRPGLFFDLIPGFSPGEGQPDVLGQCRQCFDGSTKRRKQYAITVHLDRLTASARSLRWQHILEQEDPSSPVLPFGIARQDWCPGDQCETQDKDTVLRTVVIETVIHESLHAAIAGCDHSTDAEERAIQEMQSWATVWNCRLTRALIAKQWRYHHGIRVGVIDID